MSGHALGERSGAIGLLRRLAARCGRLLPRTRAAPVVPAPSGRLTVGEIANLGWKAYGDGVPLIACPYADKRARDAWRSSWRAAQQFDRVFR